MSPGAAGDWATKFLVTNEHRADMVVASVIGELGGIDQPKALALIETLPTEAREKAVNVLGDSIVVPEFEEIGEMADKWDPEGKSNFKELLFHRLGYENLAETAEWLASNPDADPKAADVIALHLVATLEDKTEAIQWADSLLNDEARAAAISAVYQKWSVDDPQGAIDDILAYYPDSLELVADAFKGPAEARAASASHYWGEAEKLENDSARAYAITGLIEPMLLQHGMETTRERINSLPAGSLERQAAESTVLEIAKRPIVAQRLKDLAEIAQERAEADANREAGSNDE